MNVNKFPKQYIPLRILLFWYNKNYSKVIGKIIKSLQVNVAVANLQIVLISLTLINANYDQINPDWTLLILLL